MKFSSLSPVGMVRVAVVTPKTRLREALIEIADAGVMQVDSSDDRAGSDEGATRLLREAPEEVEPRLAPKPPDLEASKKAGAWDVIAGEAELERKSADGIEHGPAAVLAGWVPEQDLEHFSERLADHGTSVVRLPRPRGAEPPTRMPEGGLRRSLRPLVQTYSIVPYEDVDPSLFAGVTYVLMFGMMFGDVGHGLILAALGGLLGWTRFPRLQKIRRLWVFPFAAGLAAALFGLLYGEAFGPTGLVPTLWLSPLKEPMRLLESALGAGAALIGLSYVIGTLNRWREGGAGLALYATTGIAGAVLFFGIAFLAGAIVWKHSAFWTAGAVLGGLGLVLGFIGLRAQAGSGGAGLAEAVMGLFDAVVRIFANVVSFARLAAFGMTHAALEFAVWEGTRSLWGSALGSVAAVFLFLAGNVLAFSLEALVAGVQALRLEYYELFSRVFTGQGQKFEPWHIPLATEDQS